MSNFYFLEQEKEYSLFSSAAIEAERVYSSAPAMCAVGCRKALELAVKWVYSADSTMFPPYRVTCNPSFTSLPSVSRWTSKPGKTALYRQARQHGSPYRKAYFRR